MSELAAGFRAGTAMAQSALDAYERTRARREEEAYRAELEKLQQENAAKTLGLAPSAPIGSVESLSRMTTLPGMPQIPEAQPTQIPTELGPITGLGVQAPVSNEGYQRFVEASDPRAGLQARLALAERYGMDKDYDRYQSRLDRLDDLALAEERERQRQYEANRSFGLQQAADARAQAQADAQADALAREKKTRENEAAFVSWATKNPAATSQQMLTKLGELEITGSGAMTLVKQQLGVRDADIKRAQDEALRKLNQHRGFEAKLKAYNISDEFSPGFSLKWDDKTKELVELNDAGDEINRNKFSDKQEALLFINTRAKDEDTALKYIVDRNANAVKSTLDRMNNNQEFRLKVMEQVQEQYNNFLKNNPMAMQDEALAQQAYDKIYNDTLKFVGLSTDSSMQGGLTGTGSKFGPQNMSSAQGDGTPTPEPKPSPEPTPEPKPKPTSGGLGQDSAVEPLPLGDNLVYALEQAPKNTQRFSRRHIKEIVDSADSMERAREIRDELLKLRGKPGGITPSQYLSITEDLFDKFI